MRYGSSRKNFRALTLDFAQINYKSFQKNGILMEWLAKIGIRCSCVAKEMLFH